MPHADFARPMAWTGASWILIAMAILATAPPTNAGSSVGCPTTPVVAERTVQCAVVPGAMVSTLELDCEPCGWQIRVLAQPTGSIEIDLGWRVWECDLVLGAGPCNGLGIGFSGASHVTSTIALTNGIGAVVLDWQA